MLTKFLIFSAIFYMIIGSVAGKVDENKYQESNLIVNNYSSRAYCLDLTNGQSVWLRNTCWNGYLVAMSGEIFAQHSGLTKNDKAVEILRQSCIRFDDKIQKVQIETRYFAKSIARYICFNPCGRLTTIHKNKIINYGSLCSFKEHMDNGQVIIQSVYKSTWFLGFHGHRQMLLTTRLGDRISPHREMISEEEDIVTTSICDFRFILGEYRPQKNPWIQGIVNHINYYSRP